MFINRKNTYTMYSTSPCSPNIWPKIQTDTQGASSSLYHHFSLPLAWILPSLSVPV